MNKVYPFDSMLRAFGWTEPSEDGLTLRQHRRHWAALLGKGNPIHFWSALRLHGTHHPDDFGAEQLDAAIESLDMGALLAFWNTVCPQGQSTAHQAIAQAVRARMCALDPTLECIFTAFEGDPYAAVAQIRTLIDRPLEPVPTLPLPSLD